MKTGGGGDGGTACPPGFAAYLQTLTNVEEQDSPDWESQSSQVALRVRTPLEANHQQEAEDHRAHLRGGEGKERRDVRLLSAQVKNRPRRARDRACTGLLF